MYRLAPETLMENKTYSETERALLLQLREAVNSREEFDYINAELALAATSSQAPGRPIRVTESASRVRFVTTKRRCTTR